MCAPAPRKDPPQPAPATTPPPVPAATAAAADEDGVAVYFSPAGHCTEAIVQEIQKAKRSIRVLAHRFTSPEIDAALMAARARSVEVSIVLDGAQQTEQNTDATVPASQGIQVLIDASHAIANNRVMLIDDADIITGSFNFTAAAENSNAENLLVIQSKPILAKAYLAEFQKHAAHSKPYRAPVEAGGEKK